MPVETYLKLEPSEAVVVHAASRLFAAYISVGLVQDENEEQMMLKAIRTAMKMALTTDKLVQSDQESSGLPPS